MKRINTTKALLAGAALAGIVTGGFAAKSQAAMRAMFKMKKIIIADLEKAVAAAQSITPRARLP